MFEVFDVWYFGVRSKTIIDRTPTSLRVLVHSKSEDIAEICTDLFHKIEIYFKEKFLLIC